MKLKFIYTSRETVPPGITKLKRSQLANGSYQRGKIKNKKKNLNRILKKNK